MSLRRLIFIMLAVAALLMPTKVSAAQTVPASTLESINQNNDRPQWSDLGLEHILAVNGQSNITPPSPVRLASQGRRLAGGNNHTAGDSPETVAQMAGHFANVHCATRLRTSWTKGYLFIIQCLRL